jgi:hypothetical protein
MNGREFEGLFGRKRILWQTRWGFYALGLNESCPLGAVLCVDDSPAYPAMASQSGTRFLSLESHTPRRSSDQESVIEEIVPATSADMVELLRESEEDWTAVAANPSHALAHFAQRMGIPYISPPPQLCDWLNDKTNFLTALSEIGLPQLTGRWLRLSDMSYAELKSELGASFVAQRPHGCTGSGTFFIGSAEEHQRAAEECGEALVRVASDVGDLSLNINAIATEKGTAVGHPSVQLAAVPTLCSKRGQYCGNDYAATVGLEPRVIDDVVEQTQKIGEWLVSLGYLGLFGLDFVVDPESNRAYAVDLNPRWQGSTWLLGQSQFSLGRFPLPVADIAYRMGLLSAAELLRYSDDFLAPVSVSQFIVRSHEPGWSKIGKTLEPGIYSISTVVQQLRSTQHVRDLLNDGEFLVVGAPQPAVLMPPGGHILRACSRVPVYDLARAQLFSQAENALRQLYASLALTAGRAPNFGQ